MPTAFTFTTMGGELNQNVDPMPLIVRGGYRMARELLDASVTTTVTEIVSARPPQHGIPLAQRIIMLRQLLASGTPVYVGLFSGMPELDGTGGIEATGSGYARVAHSGWAFQVQDYIVRRVNVGTITFATLTGNLTVRGWGIWDQSSGGNLLAFGLLRSPGGAPLVHSLGAGDIPRFSNNELRVGIQ